MNKQIGVLQMRMNVESFNLDHTKVKAPYVRVADRKRVRMAMSSLNTTSALNNQIKNTWTCQVYIHLST